MLQFQLNKENIVKIILFLMGIILSYLLGKNIFATLLLLIASFFYYLYLSLKNKKYLRFFCWLISVVGCGIGVIILMFSLKSLEEDKERPLITLTQTIIAKLGDSLCVEIPFVNIGKTTAYKIELKKGLKIGGNGITSKEWDAVFSAPIEVTSIQEPNNTGSTIICNSISTDDYSRITSGNKNLFIFGIINYTDKSNKKRYYRKYCFKYNARFGIFEDYDNCNDSN